MDRQMLKSKVTFEPTRTASTLKNKHPELAKDLLIRTIQHHLQRDLFTDSARNCDFLRKKVRRQILSDLKKAMLSDGSTFRLARGAFKFTRRSNYLLSCDPKCTLRQLIMRCSVMVWILSLGIRAGEISYFLLKNITASGCDYINVLIFKGTFVSTLVNS